MGFSLRPGKLSPQQVKKEIDTKENSFFDKNLFINNKTVDDRIKRREYRRDLAQRKLLDTNLTQSKDADMIKRSQNLVDNNGKVQYAQVKQAALIKLALMRLAINYILRQRATTDGMEKSAWGGRWAAARAQRAYARGNYARGNRLMQRAYRRGYPQPQYYYPQQPAAPAVSQPKPQPVVSPTPQPLPPPTPQPLPLPKPYLVSSPAGQDVYHTTETNYGTPTDNVSPETISNSRRLVDKYMYDTMLKDRKWLDEKMQQAREKAPQLEQQERQDLLDQADVNARVMSGGNIGNYVTGFDDAPNISEINDSDYQLEL